MSLAISVLVGVAGTYAGLRGLGALRWHALTRARLRALAVSRRGPRIADFDPAELDALPPAVARYLRKALPVGAPVIRSVEVRHHGTFNLDVEAERWRPFVSRQWVETRGPGFLWNARIDAAPGLPVYVHDAYLDGQGLLEPALLGLWGLGRSRDDGVLAEGELLRFLAEAVWYPSALLPSQGVRWTGLDEHRARVTLAAGRHQASLDVDFDEAGLISTVRAERRGRMREGALVPTPWEARMSRYERREGWLVPLQGEVAWLTEQGRCPYWRGSIDRIRFNG